MSSNGRSCKKFWSESQFESQVQSQEGEGDGEAGDELHLQLLSSSDEDEQI